MKQTEYSLSNAPCLLSVVQALYIILICSVSHLLKRNTSTDDCLFVFPRLGTDPRFTCSTETDLFCLSVGIYQQVIIVNSENQPIPVNYGHSNPVFPPGSSFLPFRRILVLSISSSCLSALQEQCRYQFCLLS